jgi:site-specific recombinase XerD
MGEESVQRTRDPWSTRKKDKAPRGVYRHPNGDWAIRFTCGAGHLHKEQVGRVKTDAIDIRNERRARAHREPGWCPLTEAQQARADAKEAQRRERARVSFNDHAQDFVQWAKVNHRSWAKDDSRLSRVTPVLGAKKLDEITTADVERFLASIREGERAVSPASVNRYRDLLSGLFKRAMRLGLVASNPVRGIPKLREAGRRLTYLPPDGIEEAALHEALSTQLQPLFTVSLHTGLRWSEQMGLRWRDADMLNRQITVGRSKNGASRLVPMNAVVRSVLLDLGTQRKRPDDPDEPIFVGAYRTLARTFTQAVSRAQIALRASGKDATRLDGYTWHANRHTFASRLVMKGVDLRTVQELGGWKTLSMVQRYSHLAPSHLQAAVERLVPQNAVELARN